MIYEVMLSLQANADLRNIFEYIFFELQSPLSACGQLDRIEKVINSLKRMPEKFQKYDSEPWKSRGLRIISVDNYCIFYIPDKTLGIVTVIRVIYGGRDIKKELED